MAPRRRVTPSGISSLSAPSGITFVPVPQSSSCSAASTAYVSSSSAITKEVPERGDLWALILFTCGVVAALSFGIGTFLVAVKMESSLGAYIFEHWSDLDCGAGSLRIIEVRKPSGLLKSKLPYLAPSFGISFGLAYLFLGVIFLIRRSNLTQWIAGAAAIFGTIFTVLLARFSSYQAFLASLVFAVSSLISLVTWYDSRHLSRSLVQLIFKICKASPGLFGVSVSASVLTVGAYTLFLLFLYNMKQIWDSAYPGCTKDRNSYLSWLVLSLVLVSVLLYWITITIATVGQTLAAASTQKYLCNFQPGLEKSIIRRCSIGRILRFGCGSVCFGAGLLSLSLFLKDLSMGLMQISFAPMGAFKALTAALLMAMLTYMAPLYTRLDAKINDWAFTIIALDGNRYWSANRTGTALMQRAGLDFLAKDTGLWAMFQYIPLAVGGTSAVTTYLIVSLIPGPILQTQDVLFADILIAFAFLGGMQITRAVFAPFKGVMCTVWVVMAREPRLFEERYGDVWGSLVELNQGVAAALLERES